MRVHVYTTCWNDKFILPFFLRHYESLAEKIVVFDNMSTDDSQSIVEDHPLCELREFDTGNRFDELTLMKIRNSAWKESRGSADWVVVCDSDEFLLHPSATEYLEHCRTTGITVCKPHGYQMVSDTVPVTDRPLVEQINTGVPSAMYGKSVLFNPNAIDSMKFLPGSHACRPKGNVVTDRNPDLKLLHYKFIGGVSRVEERWKEYGQRMSWVNKLLLFSIQYLVKSRARKKYNALLSESRPINL